MQDEPSIPTPQSPAKITTKVHAALLAGGTLLHEATGALVRKEGSEFVMHGRTGRHALDAASTPARRLDAHWQHFAA